MTGQLSVMMRLSVKILILFLLPQAVFSQIYSLSPDSLQSGNSIKTDFFNDLSAANIVSGLFYKNSFGKVNLEVLDRYTSSITKFSENFSNDYNDFDAKTTYSLTDRFSAGGGVFSKILYSNQTSDLNKGHTNFLFSAFDYSPLDILMLKSRLGYKDETQANVNSSGFAGVIDGNLSGLYLDEFMSNAVLHLSLDEFQERTNYSADLSSDLSKQFTENAYNKGILRAYSNRVDFYTPATKSIANEYGVGNNIQSRLENYFLLGDNLNYNFTRSISMKLNGIFYLKEINNNYRYKSMSGNIFLENIYDNRIFENLLQAGTELEFRKGIISTRLTLSYLERDESHTPENISGYTQQQQNEVGRTEKDKNNDSKTTSAFLEFYVYPTAFNTIKFQGATSLLRYDTDSETNFDDRDELLNNIIISHRYNNMRNFYLESSFEFNSSVLNYIFKEKSSNNNTNNVYKLSSASLFSPVNSLTTKNFFQVLANYTVYKYEDVVSQVQSFSFRQLYISDSTDYSLTRKFIVGVFGELRLYEQGQYNDEKFSVKPLAYYEERTLGLKLNYDIMEFFRVFAGFRHFMKRNYAYDSGEKSLKRTQTTAGPYAGIILGIKNNSSLYILGGLDKIQASDNSLTSWSKNLIIKVIWNL
jgi:hypothetical protein